MNRAYKRLAIKIFGSFADRYDKSFVSLKPYLVSSNIGVLLRAWISVILLSMIVSYIASFAAILVAGYILSFEIMMFVSLLASIPFLVAAFVFLIFYLYPVQVSKSLKSSIENDMPFALAHMNAIASSGLPPEFMFELLTGYKEYKAISGQAELIVRNINRFGMSSVNAISSVAERSPSQPFKELLMGITSTIEKGGNIVNYLREMTEKSLFEYRIQREKYVKTLSTYADIYTTLLVAAPLILLAVLGIMSVIGGQVFGLAIEDFIFLITWVILPSLNIVFLAFVHLTHPGF